MYLTPEGRDPSHLLLAAAECGAYVEPLLTNANLNRDRQTNSLENVTPVGL